MSDNGYGMDAARYARRPVFGTDYLAFRDLPGLFARLKVAGRALDYGCGAGRSARFLKAQGFAVTGADIDGAMLAQAVAADPEGEYVRAEADRLPLPDGAFDLVFSSYMVLELATREALARVFRETARVLSVGGTGVVVTNTPEFYRGCWVSCEVDFPENRAPLVGGQAVRVRLVPEGVDLRDTFWSDADYKEAIVAAGLRLQEEHRPLGRDGDPVAWKDESRLPPYAIYVFRKEDR